MLMKLGFKAFQKHIFGNYRHNLCNIGYNQPEHMINFFVQTKGGKVHSLSIKVRILMSKQFQSKYSTEKETTSWNSMVLNYSHSNFAGCLERHSCCMIWAMCFAEEIVLISLEKSVLITLLTSTWVPITCIMSLCVAQSFLMMHRGRGQN